jgi:hypothetical protein
MRYDSTTIRNHRKNEIASKQEEAISEGEPVPEYFMVQYDLKLTRQPLSLYSFFEINWIRNKTRRGNNPSLHAYQLLGNHYIQVKLGGKIHSKVRKYYKILIWHF